MIRAIDVASACLALLILATPDATGTPQSAWQVVEEGRWLDDDPDYDEHCGSSVAIDGDTAVVGIPQDNLWYSMQGQEGTVQVYRRLASGWSREATLTARDPSDAKWFGYDIAISGNTIAVAMPSGSLFGTHEGSIHVFVRGATGWVQQAMLTPADPLPVPGFGDSVDLDGDSIVAGSYEKLYVFVRQGRIWTQQADITTPVRINGSIAIDGDTVVVGEFTQRLARVFVRSATTWAQQATLIPSDPLNAVYFGGAVAIDGNSVVIGASWGKQHSGIDFGKGTAYVFERSGSSWVQQAKLYPLDLAGVDLTPEFGADVDIQGNVIVVGMCAGNHAGVVRSGCAYVYERSGQGWNRIARFGAGSAAYGDYFGASVAVAGPRVVVGVPAYDHGALQDAGSAQVFKLIR